MWESIFYASFVKIPLTCMLKQRIGANFKNAESAKINGGLSIFFEKFYTLGSVYPGTNFKEKLSMGSEHTDYTLIERAGGFRVDLIRAFQK